MKVTVLLAIVMMFHRLSCKATAAFRHGILCFGLIFAPVLAACHFVLPSIPIAPEAVNWFQTNEEVSNSVSTVAPPSTGEDQQSHEIPAELSELDKA